MTSGTPSVPRWAERLLRWSLAPAERPAVLGDLQEEFETLVETGQWEVASRWYRRQVLLSLAPNTLRRIRLAWSSRYGTEDARQARRQLLEIAGLFAVGAFVMGALGALVTDDWLGWTGAFPLGLLAVLFGASAVFARALPDGKRRRMRPGVLYGQVASLLAGLLMFAHVRGEISFSVLTVSLVLNFWPERYWPRPKRRLPVRYSVRSPVVAGRDPEGRLFGTETVPGVPMAMSPLAIGFPLRMPDPSEDPTAHAMTATIDRKFAPGTALRLFAIVNADPTQLHATAELLTSTPPRVARRWAAIVIPATPRLPYQRPWVLPPDEAPVVPPTPISEVEATVELADLPAGAYTLRLTATSHWSSSRQESDIEILPAMPAKASHG